MNSQYSVDVCLFRQWNSSTSRQRVIKTCWQTNHSLARSHHTTGDRHRQCGVYDCWLSMTKSGCCYVSMAGFIHKKLESSNTFQTTVGQLVWSLYMAVCKNLCFLCDYSVMKWQVECTVCSNDYRVERDRQSGWFWWLTDSQRGMPQW